MSKEALFFDSWYLNNRFLRNSRPLKIRFLQCYVVLWIHNIDAICINLKSIDTLIQKCVQISKEKYCYTDEPLDVNQYQFEVLIRSFRNFILLLTAPSIKVSRQLTNEFKKQSDWCLNTNRLLVVSTHDKAIIKVSLLAEQQTT